MIEIVTFGLMVLTLIAGALVRDFVRAKRDRARAGRMGRLVSEFTSQPVESLVYLIGDPFETTEGASGRALFVWKSPPNEKLPRGSGLLTLIVTVEPEGKISRIEWRDHIS